MDVEMDTCLVCLEAVPRTSGRACGFCEKRVCASCLPGLTELDADGEADSTNGDLRCPHCRASLIEGDLHRRALLIARYAPARSEGVVRDTVTLEDLIARLMQLCLPSHISAEHPEAVHIDVSTYYNEPAPVVAAAIAADAQYASMLQRVLKSDRRARQVRHALRRDPQDKGTVSTLCREYLELLTRVAGLVPESARGSSAAAGAAATKRRLFTPPVCDAGILEEVAQQGLKNEPDPARRETLPSPSTRKPLCTPADRRTTRPPLTPCTPPPTALQPLASSAGGAMRRGLLACAVGTRLRGGQPSSDATELRRRAAAAPPAVATRRRADQAPEGDDARTTVIEDERDV